MAFTEISGLGTNLVKSAFDKYVEFSLRTAVTYRAIVDKRPVDQAMPGSSVVFNIYPDMSPVTSNLTETVDPDAVAIPATSTVTVTLGEWGNAIQVTRKLRLLSLSDVDPALADLVAFNMVDSLDRQIMTIAAGGTNVIRENAGKQLINSGSTGAVVSTDTFKSRNARAATTGMRTRAALPREQELYIGFIHPDGPQQCWVTSTARELRLPLGDGYGRMATATPLLGRQEYLERRYRSEPLRGYDFTRMKALCGWKPRVPSSLSMVAAPHPRRLCIGHSYLLGRPWPRWSRRSPEFVSAQRLTA